MGGDEKGNGREDRTGDGKGRKCRRCGREWGKGEEGKIEGKGKGGELEKGMGGNGFASVKIKSWARTW